MTDQIRAKLIAAFQPLHLDIINESHKHQGHAGDDGSGESHFRVMIVSDRFSGLGRVDRQRKVYEVLGEELSGSLHALSLTIQSPEEASS